MVCAYVCVCVCLCVDKLIMFQCDSLWSLTSLLSFVLYIFSPGVIVTEVHKRAGLDEEQYAKVTSV